FCRRAPGSAGALLAGELPVWVALANTDPCDRQETAENRLEPIGLDFKARIRPMCGQHETIDHIRQRPDGPGKDRGLEATDRVTEGLRSAIGADALSQITL